MNTPWHKIMEQLTGRRLAVYDDLGGGTPIDTTDLRVQQALSWLVYHQLVEIRDGRYHARSVADAQERWRDEGGASEAAANVARSHPHSPDPESPTRASAEAQLSSAGAARVPAPAEPTGERLTLEHTPRRMRRTFEAPKKDEAEAPEPRLPDHPNQTSFL